MTGKSKWNEKPDRIADAHPNEVYDADRNCYFYKKRENRFLPRVVIECDIAPTKTEEYAEQLRGIFSEMYPDYDVVGDAPFAIQMSIYPAHIYAGGLQPYVMGESIPEWENWLLRAFKGVVWASENQICTMGTEIRHRDHEGIRIRIYAITEQLRNYNKKE